MAALSRRKPGDPRLAERFELYVCGLELANAFQELTDPQEQRARFLADQARKQALYGETYPIDEDFLAALDHGLPECAGIALGFDRLVMLCTGAAHIEEVLWAPVESARNATIIVRVWAIKWMPVPVAIGLGSCGDAGLPDAAIRTAPCDLALMGCCGLSS